MSTLQELIAQQAEIAQRIAEIQRTERANAIAQIKALMNDHGLTAADIAGRAPVVRAEGESKPRSAVAVKFRNAATGETWTGRGLQPKWLKAALASGAKIEDFSV